MFVDGATVVATPPTACELMCMHGQSCLSAAVPEPLSTCVAP